MTVQNTDSELTIVDEAQLKKDLQIIDPQTPEVDPARDQALEDQSNRVVEALFALDPGDHESRESGKNAAEAMGMEAQEASSTCG